MASIYTTIADAVAAAALISSVWSLVAVLFRIHVIWVYYIVFVLPMSALASFGLSYFGIIRWLEKLISN